MNQAAYRQTRAAPAVRPRPRTAYAAAAWVGCILLTLRILDIYLEFGLALTGIRTVPTDQRDEAADRYVLAVELSPAMRAQRPAHLAPAIDAVAEHLPLDDRSVDAVMATLTVHQWLDPLAGLAELRRVARGPVVILTFDPDALDRFWLADYAPELIEVERHRYPPIQALLSALGDHTDVRPILVPNDCRDGFTEAYYARPEQLLDQRVRRAQSAWGFVGPGAERRFVAALRADLASGAWDRRYGTWRSQPRFDGALRLVVGSRLPREAAWSEQGRY